MCLPVYVGVDFVLYMCMNVCICVCMYVGVRFLNSAYFEEMH